MKLIFYMLLPEHLRLALFFSGVCVVPSLVFFNSVLWTIACLVVWPFHCLPIFYLHLLTSLAPSNFFLKQNFTKNFEGGVKQCK